MNSSNPKVIVDNYGLEPLVLRNGLWAIGFWLLAFAVYCPRMGCFLFNLSFFLTIRSL